MYRIGFIAFTILPKVRKLQFISYRDTHDLELGIADGGRLGVSAIFERRKQRQGESNYAQTKHLGRCFETSESLLGVSKSDPKLIQTQTTLLSLGKKGTETLRMFSRACFNGPT